MKHDDLIIDVGFHKGEDAQFYLDKGFRVVGVEANPALVQDAKQQFAAAIADGRLTLFGVAIANRDGTAELTVVDNIPGWSSLVPELVESNAVLSPITWHVVEVPTIRFEQILDQVGIPHYLKVDIEGLDMLCVEALQGFPDRPDFVSLESAVTRPKAGYTDMALEIWELSNLGFTQFAYVNQNAHPYRRAPYPAREGSYVDEVLTPEHSGFFGDELPARWMPRELALAYGALIHSQYNVADPTGAWTVGPYARACDAWWRLRHPDSRGTQRWYDLHAK